jgi:hypothetical protein
MSEVKIMARTMANSVLSNQTYLPISFIKNQGQEDERTYFSTHVQNRKVFCSSDRITLVELEQVETPSAFHDSHNSDELRNGVALQLSFTGANAELAPEGVTELSGRHNYLRGADQSQWTSGVLHYKSLFYSSVWDGVDLEIHGSKTGLKMNWVLDNPAKASDIVLHWAGADSLTIDETGNLLVHHFLGTLTDLFPYAYQEINDEKVSVDCTYLLNNDFNVGFELNGSYDPELPLIIDPFVQFTTYLGGSNTSNARAVSVDSSNCAYIAGQTDSINFPTTLGAFQIEISGNYDAFVTKFSADGSSLLYSTYLGGSSYDIAYGITVDSEGIAYITGYTISTDFPITPGTYQTTLGGLGAGFVTKLAADGANLIYSTYLGGEAYTNSYCITIDAESQAYVAGDTDSSTFPVTSNAFQSSLNGDYDSFLTIFSADGVNLIYSSYFGGSSGDYVYGIAIDSQKNIHICGDTYSTDFPVTPGAFQTANVSNLYTGFLSKFAVNGESLIYSTYLGGTLSSVVSDISINSSDCACVTGQTYCQDFPVTPNAFQQNNGYLNDANGFISILSTDGSALVASTYLGGSTPTLLSRQIAPTGDDGAGIAVNKADLIYITGSTNSSDFPTTPLVIPSAYSGNSDAFISILSKDLSSLLVSYYLGGTFQDFGMAIVVDATGALYATGYTNSTDFPTTEGAYQENSIGFLNAYLTKATFPFVFYSRASLTLQGLF